MGALKALLDAEGVGRGLPLTVVLPKKLGERTAVALPVLVAAPDAEPEAHAMDVVHGVALGPAGRVPPGEVDGDIVSVVLAVMAALFVLLRDAMGDEDGAAETVASRDSEEQALLLPVVRALSEARTLALMEGKPELLPLCKNEALPQGVGALVALLGAEGADSGLPLTLALAATLGDCSDVAVPVPVAAPDAEPEAHAMDVAHGVALGPAGRVPPGEVEGDIVSVVSAVTAALFVLFSDAMGDTVSAAVAEANCDPEAQALLLAVEWALSETRALALVEGKPVLLPLRKIEALAQGDGALDALVGAEGADTGLPLTLVLAATLGDCNAVAVPVPVAAPDAEVEAHAFGVAQVVALGP